MLDVSSWLLAPGTWLLASLAQVTHEAVLFADLDLGAVDPRVAQDLLGEFVELHLGETAGLEDLLGIGDREQVVVAALSREVGDGLDEQHAIATPTRRRMHRQPDEFGHGR